MPQPLVVVDVSDVHVGKRAELESALEGLVAFVEANEAEPLLYSIHFDESGERMTVVQVHPSSESMERHMDIAAPVFRELTGLLTLTQVDFYGAPSPRLLEQMRQKARLLGNALVEVHERQAGFARLELPQRR
jgi:hypothetical protein